MSVVLPTSPAPQSAELYFLDAGGVQKSIAGGDDMRLDKLGDHFGMTVALVPMKWNGLTDAQRVHAARVWTVRLAQGLSQGAILPVPQPGFTPAGNPSTAAAVALSGSSQVNVTNNGPSVRLLEGQMFTHTRGSNGRRYNYQVRADTVLPANGAAVVPFWPRCRAPMAIGDTLEFRRPTMEGLIRGDRVAWALAVSRLAAIQFTIEERG